MKFARDFRQRAREALSGRWGLAVGVGIVASLLGGGNTSLSAEINVKVNEDGSGIYFENGLFSYEATEFLARYGMAILIIALVTSVAMFIIGSIVETGYARFNLELIDDGLPEFNNLFAYFKHWKGVTVANLLRTVYIFLWMLLFIIPGIVASYSYAMTPYIMADNPNLPASEAVAMSKEMMAGNRFRLFCLELSFIGWEFLCILTFGIGFLWLAPYMAAARADFYREVSGTCQTVYSIPENDPQAEA